MHLRDCQGSRVRHRSGGVRSSSAAVRERSRFWNHHRNDHLGSPPAGGSQICLSATSQRLQIDVGKRRERPAWSRHATLEAPADSFCVTTSRCMSARGLPISGRCKLLRLQDWNRLEALVRARGALPDRLDRDSPIRDDGFELTRMTADLHLYATYAQVAALRLLGPAEHRLPGVPMLRASSKYWSGRMRARVLGRSARSSKQASTLWTTTAPHH